MSSTPSPLVLRQKALIENPAPRVPICLVLDASGSMDTVVGGNYAATGGTVFKDGRNYKLVQGDTVTRMDQLNFGLGQFFSELLADDNTRNSAEVCLISFSDTATVIRDFEPLADNHATLSVQSQGGNTSLGQAVKLAMELLDRRKTEYQNAGVDYYQPWLVVITDGVPTDDTHKSVAVDVTARVEAKKLTVFPIAVGDEADLTQLAVISPKRPPVRLQGVKFKEFFEWLSKSVARVSASIPGETVPLDTKGMSGWAEL